MAGDGRPTKPPGFKISDYIVSRILADVGSGRWNADDQISQSDLVDRYECSLAAVREALRVLEMHRVVEMRPGRNGGLAIGEVEPRGFWHMSTIYFQAANACLRDAVEAQLIVEPAAARLAAQHAEPQGIATLWRTVEELEAACEEGPTANYIGPSNRFHLEIARMSANPVLETYAASLRQIYMTVLGDAFFPSTAHREVCTAHAAIARAIEQGREGLSERRMRQHMREYLSFWNERFPGLLEARIRWAPETD